MLYLYQEVYQLHEHTNAFYIEMRMPANILPASRSASAKTRSGGLCMLRFRAEYQNSSTLPDAD